MTLAKLSVTLPISSTPASTRRTASSALTPRNTMSIIRAARLLVAGGRLEHELDRLVQVRLVLRQVLADGGDLGDQRRLLGRRQADQRAALVDPYLALVGEELLHERHDA